MRQRVMDAAVDEMRLHGVRFTMNDLAGRLGVSKRTLYQIFSSKEELIGAIIVTIQDDIRKQRQELLSDQHLDFPAKFQGMIAVRQKAFSAFEGGMFAEIRRCFPGVWSKVEQFINDEWSAVEAVLQAGMAAGRFQTRFVPLITMIVKGSIKEMIRYDFDCCKDVTKLVFMEQLSEIILYGIVKREEN